MDLSKFHNNTLDHHLEHELLEIKKDFVKSKLIIQDKHKQPMGLVHGGTYATLAETVCSYGANYDSSSIYVGVNNNTDFLISAKEGELICEAKPISKGKSYQLWECRIFNCENLCAVSKVRLQKIQ